MKKKEPFLKRQDSDDNTARTESSDFFDNEASYSDAKSLWNRNFLNN